MEFNIFVRKPFVVEAVEVTSDNIEEIAKLVGKLETKETGEPYIQVDRKLVPNVYRVFPGYFMTKMGDNVRCYSKKIFHEQFVASSPEIQEYVSFMESQGIVKEEPSGAGSV